MRVIPLGEKLRRDENVIELPLDPTGEGARCHMDTADGGCWHVGYDPTLPVLMPDYDAANI